MSDVWMVSHGRYSSYAVVAVFSTESDAEAWANEHNAQIAASGRRTYEDPYVVERVDFNPPLASVVRASMDGTNGTW